MECYLSTSRYNKDSKEVRGFVALTENQRETAKAWSHNDRPIQIPDILENLTVRFIEDRMNNKIFKVGYKLPNKDLIVLFDLYCYEMLDLIKHGSIENGVIKSGMTFISGGRLTSVDGDLYKEYIEKERIKAEFKNAKRISVKDLKIGNAYKAAPTGVVCIYGGKCAEGHILIELPSWRDDLKEYSYIKLVKSPSFKFCCEESNQSMDDLREFIKVQRRHWSDHPIWGYAEEQVRFTDLLENSLNGVDK